MCVCTTIGKKKATMLLLDGHYGQQSRCACGNAQIVVATSKSDVGAAMVSAV
jgi:hypothetical protein